MKSKEIKSYNLPTDDEVLYHLEVKPYITLIAMLCLGIGILMYDVSYAVLLIGVSVYALLFLPSRVLLAFTKDYLIMQNKASRDDCVIIYYDEIVSWQYINTHRVDTLVIELIDGTVEKIECFNRIKVTNYMNYFVKDKQLKTKRSI